MQLQIIVGVVLGVFLFLLFLKLTKMVFKAVIFAFLVLLAVGTAYFFLRYLKIF